MQRFSGVFKVMLLHFFQNYVDALAVLYDAKKVKVQKLGRADFLYDYITVSASFDGPDVVTRTRGFYLSIEQKYLVAANHTYCMVAE